MFFIPLFLMLSAPIMASVDLPYLNYLKKNCQIEYSKSSTFKSKGKKFYVGKTTAKCSGIEFSFVGACDVNFYERPVECLRSESVTLKETPEFQYLREKKKKKSPAKKDGKGAFLNLFIPKAHASISRFRWRQKMGYPYKAFYNYRGKEETFCYGEIEDSFKDIQETIICRTDRSQRCPHVDDCYEKRAIKGEFP